MSPERTRALRVGNEALKREVAIALEDPQGQQRGEQQVTTRVIRRRPGHDPAATDLYRSIS